MITNSDASSGLFRGRHHLYEYQPPGRVEAQAAFILAPSLELKVGGGFNMPSAVAFRVRAVVLIAAN